MASYYIWQGVTSSGLTLYNGNMLIYSGGVANSTTVNSGGYMYISSGGVANSTTVNSGGYMYISSGGTATDIIASNGARLTINVASNTYIQGTYAGSAFEMKNAYISGYTVNSSVNMYISSGGVANSTTVNSGGYMSITSGGSATDIIAHNGAKLAINVASNTYIQGTYAGSAFEMKNAYISGYTVNYGGDMVISSGGTASEIVENGGYVDVRSGANVTFASNTISGLVLSSHKMTVHQNTVANSTTVYDYGYMYISSGGIANSTTVNSAGYMRILSGGSVNNITINASGSMYIAFGGSAVEVIENGGYVDVIYGAKVTFASNTINGLTLSNASMTVHSNTVANNTTVNSGGSMTIFSGGIASGTTVNSNGMMYISSGGIAKNTTVDRGFMMIDSNGVANNNTIKSGGSMCIFFGGIANSTTVSQGCMYINSGGVANNTTVTSEGSITISSGGVANNTTVVNRGDIGISSGGTANSTTISRGAIHVWGAASNTTVSVGYMYIASGGTANSTIVNSGGYMRIYSGGTAVEIIENGGYVGTETGAKVTFASNTINGLTLSNASMTVHSNTVANSTTVNSGGCMYISSEGVVNSTTVNSGGRMNILSGGVHRGCLQIAAGAVVSARAGAKIDFTVADRTASDGYQINDLSRISGTPTYTITVSADQAAGEYKLAQGAANFTGTITIGNGTDEYGALTVNGDALFCNSRIYILKQVDGNLTLDIFRNVPENLRGSADGISWDPVLGANDYSVQYSFDNMATALTIQTLSEAVDTYNLPDDSNFWRVCASGGEWSETLHFKGSKTSGQARVVLSNEDGDTDLFFARANGTWDYGYAASHQGIKDGWSGTSGSVVLFGKNKLEDVFIGSTDANILVLTDDANGDALFVDDIYSAIGEQARLRQIDEIRAGAGDDVIDLTSQRFVYVGDGLTVYGGAGNDTIWANSGNNILFGDAGNDRIVGGSDNDIIVGGAGNDRMHGGGGIDTFCFGENWGKDTVEQLAYGEVILWFETGSEDFWNAETMTYSDGNNRVKVTGVSADDVTLKFGDVETAIAGAFDSFASEKIFEDQTKALLA